jgi:transketolase
VVARGGYVRVPGDDVVLVATGSEVGLAEETATVLSGNGVSVRVVSLPCVELFMDQDLGYQESVLGSDLPVFTLEAGVTPLWRSMTANGGIAIGIDRFGASAPATVLAEQFGFTPTAVADLMSTTLNA